MIGYRTEDFSGSGVRDLREVIAFEIDELGNSDIPLYMFENYNILQNYENIIDSIGSYTEGDELGVDEYIQDIIEDIFTFVKDKLGTPTLFAIWLTDTDKSWYIKEDSSVDKYTILGKEGEDYLVLSDLGSDGKLIAYKEAEIEYI